MPTSAVPRKLVCTVLLPLSSILLSVLLSSCGGGAPGEGVGSQPFLTLVVSPSSLVVYPSTTFTIQVTASTNASAIPTVTLASLPSGITTTATFPLAVPTGGASITFQTAATIAAGAYTLKVDGQDGADTASAEVVATVQTSPPGFFFLGQPSSEVAVPFGGSGKITISTGENGPAAYSVQLSVSGLPPGTTASIKSAGNLTRPIHDRHNISHQLCARISERQRHVDRNAFCTGAKCEYQLPRGRHAGTRFASKQSHRLRFHRGLTLCGHLRPRAPADFLEQ